MDHVEQGLLLPHVVEGVISVIPQDKDRPVLRRLVAIAISAALSRCNSLRHHADPSEGPSQPPDPPSSHCGDDSNDGDSDDDDGGDGDVPSAPEAQQQVRM